jgi:hypothetical protein
VAPLRHHHFLLCRLLRPNRKLPVGMRVGVIFIWMLEIRKSVALFT